MMHSIFKVAAQVSREVKDTPALFFKTLYVPRKPQNL